MQAAQQQRSQKQNTVTVLQSCHFERVNWSVCLIIMIWNWSLINRETSVLTTSLKLGLVFTGGCNVAVLIKENNCVRLLLHKSVRFDREIELSQLVQHPVNVDLGESSHIRKWGKKKKTGVHQHHWRTYQTGMQLIPHMSVWLFPVLLTENVKTVHCQTFLCICSRCFQFPGGTLPSCTIINTFHRAADTVNFSLHTFVHFIWLTRLSRDLLIYITGCA